LSGEQNPSRVCEVARSAVKDGRTDRQDREAGGRGDAQWPPEQTDDQTGGSSDLGQPDETPPGRRPKSP
jgi:hypothetical protein